MYYMIQAPFLASLAPMGTSLPDRRTQVMQLIAAMGVREPDYPDEVWLRLLDIAESLNVTIRSVKNILGRARNVGEPVGWCEDENGEWWAWMEAYQAEALQHEALPVVVADGALRPIRAFAAEVLAALDLAQNHPGRTVVLSGDSTRGIDAYVCGGGPSTDAKKLSPMTPSEKAEALAMGRGPCTYKLTRQDHEYFNDADQLSLTSGPPMSVFIENQGNELLIRVALVAQTVSVQSVATVNMYLTPGCGDRVAYLPDSLLT
jgi:hypothetical protein